MSGKVALEETQNATRVVKACLLCYRQFVEIIEPQSLPKADDMVKTEVEYGAWEPSPDVFHKNALCGAQPVPTRPPRSKNTDSRD